MHDDISKWKNIKKYVLDTKENNGEYLIHLGGQCIEIDINKEVSNEEDHLSVSSRIFLGFFENCDDALTIAKRLWPKLKINGCCFCCPACHKKE